MFATIRKWGNSQGIRIPKGILEMASLHENDEVSMNAEKGRIVIELVKQRHRTLDERFAGYSGAAQSQEWETGASTGKEVW